MASLRFDKPSGLVSFTALQTLTTMLAIMVGAAGAEPTTGHIVVTASRIEQSIADVPANVSIIDRSDIERSAALTVDDANLVLPFIDVEASNGVIHVVDGVLLPSG